MTTRKHTTKETIDLILSDATSLDVYSISEKYGVKQATIRSILRRNNIAAKKPNPSRFLIPKEELDSILSNGWLPVAELARICGCSYARVKKSLVAHGLLQGRKPSTRHRVNESTRSFKVLGCLMANPEMSLEAVGHQFNCTREYVSQINAMARKEGIIRSWSNSSDELCKEAQQEGVEL